MGGKTSAAAINRYKAKAYDRVETLFPKGYKEKLKKHVSNTGESVNAFIQRAVAETIEHDEMTPGFLHESETKE